MTKRTTKKSQTNLYAGKIDCVIVVSASARAAAQTRDRDQE
jgi:hypothetical protein